MKATNTVDNLKGIDRDDLSIQEWTKNWKHADLIFSPPINMSPTSPEEPSSVLFTQKQENQ